MATLNDGIHDAPNNEILSSGRMAEMTTDWKSENATGPLTTQKDVVLKAKDYEFGLAKLTIQKIVHIRRKPRHSF
jgi:hypothetical protein